MIQGGAFYTTSFYIFFVYFCILLLYYITLGVVGAMESARRRRQHDREPYEEMLESDFTIPVSIIIPAFNEESKITDTVLSILRLKYPLFELIIVDDESKDKTLDVLKKLLDLKPVSNPYHDSFKSGKIRGFFKSNKFKNVTVLSKEGGQKKAGAINAGVNVARFKYLCVIDSDTLLDKETLMKVMAHVQRAPDRVIGIGSAFGLSNAYEIYQGRIGKQKKGITLINDYQELEYARSFIGNRVAWSAWNAMPIVSGGFNIWRRDVFQSSGGADPYFSSEDLEFSLRMHERRIKESKKDWEIIMLPYRVGWTAGPENIMELMKQRNRWHRVTLEAVWKFKYMFLNPRYGYLGFVTMPYFVFYEVLGPIVEICSILILLLGAAKGLLDPSLALGFFVFMMLTNTLTTLIPLSSYQHYQRAFSTWEFIRLNVLSFFEFILYRWIIIAARLWGTFDFFRGRRQMDRIREA